MSTTFLQQEVNELKKALVNNINNLFYTKNLVGFSYRNHWQNNDTLLIVIEYTEPNTQRYLSIEFDIDLNIIFQGEPDDCTILDKSAKIDTLAIDRVKRALLRILFTIFCGCSAIKEDLEGWKKDPSIKSVSMQLDRQGSVHYYFRY